MAAQQPRSGRTLVRRPSTKRGRPARSIARRRGRRRPRAPAGRRAVQSGPCS